MVQRAPMFAKRIKAAGPGKLRARLRTRTPRKGWVEDMREDFGQTNRDRLGRQRMDPYYGHFAPLRLSLGWSLTSHPKSRAWAQAIFKTWLWPLCFLGKVSCSTPFSYLACAADWSTLSSKVKLRDTLP